MAQPHRGRDISSTPSYISLFLDSCTGINHLQYMLSLMILFLQLISKWWINYYITGNCGGRSLDSE